MQVVTPELVANKTVLLRLDLDVPLRGAQGKFEVADDFRLLAGMDTLGLCLEFARSVIIMGHIGRPQGKEVSELSVKPIVNWLEEGYGHIRLPVGKLHILENLRFEPGEESCDLSFARELAGYGNFFVNEAFASHHKSASTTLLPGLLPHAAGLNFAHEVETLLKVRNNPEKPFVAIIGGAKLEDKLPVVEVLSKVADAVLVGGKLPAEIKEKNITVPANVLVAKMNEDGFDISQDAIAGFKKLILNAKLIVWAGPMGKYEDPKYNAGNQELAKALLSSSAQIVIGGGDTLNALAGFATDFAKLNNRAFISTGGGAMLKLLSDGTLPTIEALK